MIWYWPEPSETADRVFSMRAGLDISMVTAGSTAPEVSLTTPAIVACWANAAAGNKARHRNAPANMASARFILPPEGWVRTGSDGADITPVQGVLQQPVCNVERPGARGDASSARIDCRGAAASGIPRGRWVCRPRRAVTWCASWVES